jgi:hypothetical protein
LDVHLDMLCSHTKNCANFYYYLWACKKHTHNYREKLFGARKIIFFTQVINNVIFSGDFVCRHIMFKCTPIFVFRIFNILKFVLSK